MFGKNAVSAATREDGETQSGARSYIKAYGHASTAAFYISNPNFVFSLITFVDLLIISYELFLFCLLIFIVFFKNICF